MTTMAARRVLGEAIATCPQFQFNLLSTNKTICFRKQQQKPDCYVPPGTATRRGGSRVSCLMTLMRPCARSVYLYVHTGVYDV